MPALLATNRFASPTEALAFVEQLYTLGAEAVFIAMIDHRKMNFDCAGPHSDTLIVVLPHDGAQRRAILDVVQREAKHYDPHSQPVADTGQREIRFWWD